MRSLPNTSSSTLKKSISNLKSTYLLHTQSKDTYTCNAPPPGSCDVNILHPMVIPTSNKRKEGNVAQGEIRMLQQEQQQGYTVVAGDLTVNMRRLYHVFLRSSSSTFVVCGKVFRCSSPWQFPIQFDNNKNNQMICYFVLIFSVALQVVFQLSTYFGGLSQSIKLMCLS